ncbi:MAG: helix-turn-helix domain-containing protein [Pirellulales bacterium]
MDEKLERVFRNAPLTASEAASDAAARDAIMREFPPLESVAALAPGREARDSTLSELVRKAIQESGKSLEEIAGAANVPLELLQRFMVGERDIHLHTADRLAQAVQLKVAAGS